MPITLLLAFTSPPLAVVAWILLSGDQWKTYWQSSWVKTGLAIAVVGSLPLFLVVIADQLGLLADPDPNPIGFGLLFVLGVVLGSLLALIGVVWTHRQSC
ncbi:MAG TPA: hypothetical protein VIC71_12500 [Gammaproteobacteria bacterium]